MRRRVIGVVVALLVVVSAVFYISDRGNYQRVSIELDNGVSANIFNGSNEGKSSQTKALYSFNQSFDKKIKKGTYLLTTNNSIGYVDTSQVFTVADKQVMIRLSLNLNKNKLSQLYDKEANSIIAALNAKYPATMKNYSVASPTLFKKGEWFGAMLVPPNSSLDVLRVVMKKDTAGSWSVTTTPGMVFSTLDYPQVPYEVLWNVNSLKWSWNSN